MKFVVPKQIFDDMGESDVFSFGARQSDNWLFLGTPGYGALTIEYDETRD